MLFAAAIVCLKVPATNAQQETTGAVPPPLHGVTFGLETSLWPHRIEFKKATSDSSSSFSLLLKNDTDTLSLELAEGLSPLRSVLNTAEAIHTVEVDIEDPLYSALKMIRDSQLEVNNPSFLLLDEELLEWVEKWLDCSVKYRTSVDPEIEVPVTCDSNPVLSEYRSPNPPDEIIPTVTIKPLIPAQIFNLIEVSHNEGGQQIHFPSGIVSITPSPTATLSYQPRQVPESTSSADSTSTELSPSPAPEEPARSEEAQKEEDGSNQKQPVTTGQPLMKTVLVTGASGYIGSHVTVQLQQQGYQVIALDNLSNSYPQSLDQVEKITEKKTTFVQADITDKASISQVFSEYNVDAVIHCAGLKAVAESELMPEKYHQVNVEGSRNLLESMEQAGVKTIVFSSSATVYGQQETMPIKESAPLPATASSQYAQNKLDIEKMLQERAHEDTGWRIVILRYFNPIGAHPSGDIGEYPRGQANNLLPAILRVITKQQPNLQIYTGYETKSGTGERDYIHIVDLAAGHLKALDKLKTSQGLHIYNLGTGQPYSVLDIVSVFESVSGEQIERVTAERRAGDVDRCYADASKANNELNWHPEYGLEQMIRDLWNWHKRHPGGYTALLTPDSP